MLHFTRDLKLTYRKTDNEIRLIVYILLAVIAIHATLFFLIKIEQPESPKQNTHSILLSVEKTEAMLPKWYQSLPIPPRSYD